MHEQQQYQVNLMDSTRSPYYNSNLQRLSSRIEVNQMPSVNFDTSTSNYTSSTKCVIETTTRPPMDTETTYLFKSKGKYTNQFISNVNRKTEGTYQPFRFDDTENNFCRIHNGFNDIIVTEPIGQFARHQAICRYCESDYYKLRKASGIPNKDGCILSTDVITDNTEKILNIRSGKVSITNLNDTARCNEMLFNEIMPLADELIDIVNDFNEEIISKFDGSEADNEELLKIKSFIDQIPLENGVEPKVRGIDNDSALKIKYVRLAIFLLNFTKIDSSNVDYSLVSFRLKEHIKRIVELRKCIVVQITKWLRFVLGGFYDFIFRAEGVSVDEDFRRSVKIDFYSEEEIRKITLIFESELAKRDARIRLLEEENERLKRELESMRGNLCFLNDQEEEINRLNEKLANIEAEWLLQKSQIENLTTENRRLNLLNIDYYNQINNLQNEIENMKFNFESTLKNTVNELRSQYELQIIKITEDFNDLKNKYQNDAKQWMSEREALNNRISVMMLEINGYKENINSQLNEINNLNGLLQRTRQELIIITQERDAHLRTIESLRVEIKNYQTNITNLNNQLTVVLNIRDQSNAKIEELNREIAQLKSTIMQMTNEIQICNQKIEVYINTLNGVSKERDDLKQQVILLRGDLEKKIAELQTLTNIRVSIENRLNQLEDEMRRITEVYTKLQLEFNQKLAIISELEKRVRELEGLNLTLQSQNEMYLATISKYEKLLIQINEDHLLKVQQLEKMINELRDRERELTIQLKDRDGEISRLKMTINSCKDDWNKLSESYENLLLDIKNQLQINEVLRNLVFELLNKIEMHNQSVGGLDLAIKQQIEILTRQTLSKKAIDIDRNYNIDINQATNNIDGLRQKLGKIESQKLYKSAVFNTINYSVDGFKTGSNTTVDELTQRFQKNSFNTTGTSTINFDVRKFIESGYNSNEFTPNRNTTDFKNGTPFSQSVIREVNNNNNITVIERHIRDLGTTPTIDTTVAVKDFARTIVTDDKNRSAFDYADALNNTVVLKSEDK